MKLTVLKTADEISEAVSKIIIDQIEKKPDSSLGLATGSSPIGTYEKLIDAFEKGRVSFRNVTTFNLDEYCGLSPQSKDSYRFFMEEKLFGRIDLRPENINFLNGCAEDYEEECRAYSERIEQKGIDIQLLGVGRNGHIGFNEPAEEFSDGAHPVELHQSTIDANKRFFESRERVPTSALTMGIGDIMKARKIVLIAMGEAKADAIKAMFEGEVTPHCPASILKTHPDAEIFADEASAAKLKR